MMDGWSSFLVEVVKVALIAGGGWLALSFFAAAIRIARCDKDVYERNRRAALAIRAERKGLAPFPEDDLELASIVETSLAVDSKTGEWVARRRLSDRAVRDVLG